MPTIANVQDVFQQAVSDLHKLANTAPTEDQRDAARKALDDLLLQHGTQVLQSIEGRTAVLAALIVELGDVVDAIQGAPALAGALNQITGLLTKVRDLYEQSKDELHSA